VILQVKHSSAPAEVSEPGFPLVAGRLRENDSTIRAATFPPLAGRNAAHRARPMAVDCASDGARPCEGE